MRESGIGGTFLTIYVYLGIEALSWDPHFRTQAVVAVVPVVVVILLIDALNDSIMETLAGKDFLSNVHQDLRDKIGTEEFYYDHEDKQEKINELDKKAVQKIMTMVAGIFVLITLPLFLHAEFGKVGVIVAVATSPVIIYLFIFKQYLNLRNIIMSVVRLYE